MALHIPDYLRKIHKESRKHGWTWDYRGTKHVMVLNPQGRAITTISLTAYDGTLNKKVLSQLRQAHCPGVK